MKRQKDMSGISGTGYVLTGIVFNDGKTVVHWNSDHPSTSIFDSFKDFQNIHITPHPENNTVIDKQRIKWQKSVK